MSFSVGQKIIALTDFSDTVPNMPVVFQKDGYTFFFYSNDHEPIHIHVRKGGGEAVFNVDDEVDLRESHGLKINELSKAQALTEENKEIIIQKWHEYLNR